MLDFAILKSGGTLAPRLGRLSLQGRKTILTPAFIGNTSRGAIPHISQDNYRKCGVDGVYIPLEDCMYHTIPLKIPAAKQKLHKVAGLIDTQSLRNTPKRHHPC